MAAEAPTPQAQPANPQRERWRNFFTAALQRSEMSAADFVRRADRPSITPSIVSQWQQAKSGISAETAIRVAQVFGLPATQVLHEAGHDELAAYIGDVVGHTANDAAALEPLIARVRNITRDLTPEQRRGLEEDLLRQVGDWYLLAEAKAAQLRRDADPDSARGAS